MKDTSQNTLTVYDIIGLVPPDQLVRIADYNCSDDEMPEPERLKDLRLLDALDYFCCPVVELSIDTTGAEPVLNIFYDWEV